MIALAIDSVSKGTVQIYTGKEEAIVGSQDPSQSIAEVMLDALRACLEEDDVVILSNMPRYLGIHREVCALAESAPHKLYVLSKRALDNYKRDHGISS